MKIKLLFSGTINNYKKYVKPKQLYWVLIVVNPLLLMSLMYLFYYLLTYQRPEGYAMFNDAGLMYAYCLMIGFVTLVTTHRYFVDKGIEQETRKNKKDRERFKSTYFINKFLKDEEILVIYDGIPKSRKEEFIDIMFERELLKNQKGDEYRLWLSE